jgi:hypothetical protein
MQRYGEFCEREAQNWHKCFPPIGWKSTNNRLHAINMSTFMSGSAQSNRHESSFRSPPAVFVFPEQTGNAYQTSMRFDRDGKAGNVLLRRRMPLTVAVAMPVISVK